MNYRVKLGVLSVLVGLTACGGETAQRDVGGQEYRPPIVELDVPDYAIAGQTFTLAARVSDPEGEDVSGRWQQKGSAGYFDLAFTDQALETDATLSLSKAHDPQQDRVTFRFVASDASGSSAAAQIELPVYDAPLNVGYALTLKAGQPVTLVMKPDEAFEREVAGSYDTYSWAQTGGPKVELEAVDSFTAHFTAPSVEVITQLTFKAEARASVSSVEVAAEKVVFLVPESEWVDAVAIHHTDNISAVLRADGSLLVLKELEPEQLLTGVAEVSGVADLNGSHHSAAVLYRDGTARTLYPAAVDHKDYLPAGLSGVKELAGSRSLSEFAGRSALYYLTTSGDLYLSEIDGPVLVDSGLGEITTAFLRGYRLNAAGEWLDSDGAVMVDQVRHVSGEAYLLNDGSIGHLSRGLPEYAFPTARRYADVMAGAVNCSDTVFAITEDGSVDGFTPNSYPLPPELANVAMLKASCRSHMALDATGTVFLWPGSQIVTSSGDDQFSIFSGETPSLLNLK